MEEELHTIDTDISYSIEDINNPNNNDINIISSSDSKNSKDNKVNIEEIEKMKEKIENNRELGFSDYPVYSNTEDGYSKNSIQNRKFLHKLFKACILVIVAIFIIMILGFINVVFFKTNSTSKEVNYIQTESNQRIMKQIGLKLISSKASLEYLEDYRIKLLKDIKKNSINDNNECSASLFYKVNLIKGYPCLISNSKDANKEISSSSLKEEVVSSYLELLKYISSKSHLSENSSKSENNKKDDIANDEYLLNLHISKYLLENKNKISQIKSIYNGEFTEAWIQIIQLNNKTKNHSNVSNKDKNINNMNNNDHLILYNKDRIIYLIDHNSKDIVSSIKNENYDDDNNNNNIDVICSIKLIHLLNYELHHTIHNNKNKMSILLSDSLRMKTDEYLEYKNNPLLVVDKEVMSKYIVKNEVKNNNKNNDINDESGSPAKTEFSFTVKLGEGVFIPSYYYTEIQACWNNKDKEDKEISNIKFMSYMLTSYNRNLNNIMNIILNGY